jgi:hypothetical protein
MLNLGIIAVAGRDQRVAEGNVGDGSSAIAASQQGLKRLSAGLTILGCAPSKVPHAGRIRLTAFCDLCRRLHHRRHTGDEDFNVLVCELSSFAAQALYALSYRVLSSRRAAHRA